MSNLRPPYLHRNQEYISIGFGTGPDTLLKVPAGETDRERVALWVEQVRAIIAAA